MANIKNKVVAEALGTSEGVFKGDGNVFVQTPLLLCPCGADNQKVKAQEISPQESMEQLIAHVNNQFPMGKVSAKGIQDVVENDLGVRGDIGAFFNSKAK